MNKNLFIKELGKNAMALIFWMAVITFLVSVTLSAFPAFLENQTKIMGLLRILPKGVLQFKGISNTSDLLSVLGFYAVNNVIYMMVLGSIFSIVLASGILLKEEYEKTAEYLLTRPVTRSEVFFSKLSVVFLNIFLLNMVTALAGFISMELVKQSPYQFSSFLILSLYTLLLNLLFGSAGLFISTIIKRAKPVTTFSIGLVLVFYFIFTFSKITEKAADIGYLSPFKYVDAEVIKANYQLNPVNLVYFIGISVVLIFLSYRLYLRKDIYT